MYVTPCHFHSIPHSQNSIIFEKLLNLSNKSKELNIDWRTEHLKSWKKWKYNTYLSTFYFLKKLLISYEVWPNSDIDSLITMEITPTMFYGKDKYHCQSNKRMRTYLPCLDKINLTTQKKSERLSSTPKYHQTKESKEHQ